MRYGVTLPNSGPFASPDNIARVAILAEKLGYDAVRLHDHVNWGHSDRYHFYAGSKEAADARGAPTDFYEAMATLAYVSGITHRIKLITTALCLAWRPVVLLAREALTLHHLSRGRFVLCVCVGNVRRDFEVTSTSWDDRARIALEKLKVLRMVIDQAGPLSFHGDYVRFKDLELNPRPVGLPLWWAGSNSDVAVRRAARFGEGLLGSGLDYFRQKVPVLREELERLGRQGVEFEVGSAVHVCVASSNEEAREISRQTLAAHSQSEWMQRHDASARSDNYLVGTPETIAATVEKYREAGVTMLGLCFVGHSLSSLTDQMQMFSEEVMPDFK